MVDYKLLTYASSNGPRAGVAVGDKVFDLAAITAKQDYATVLDVLGDWQAAQALLDMANVNSLEGRGLAETKLLSPVLYPSAIYCAGANYTDHQAEMERVQNMPAEVDPHSIGLKPWHFVKTSRSIAGPGVCAKIPLYAKALDWEGELVAVIGKPAKDVSLKEALDYVAGYTLANDLSARDAMKRPGVSSSSPFQFDWVGQKCFDDACPVGPWIVPAKQVGDPQHLGIKLWVNDVPKQESHTAKMIFTVAEQISHLSTRMTLQPGDLILTGTPAGVGMARGEFLKPGDIVRVWVEKVGTLTHTIG